MSLFSIFIVLHSLEYDNKKVSCTMSNMSLQNVVQKLKQTSEKLHQWDVPSLHAFTTAYIMVTENFQSAIDDGLFQFPELVQKLDEAFATYYFHAMSKKDFPPEWRTITEARQKEHELFSLLLGANVHIHHDLPLALLETIQEPKKFEHDFFIVKKVFAHAIQDMLKVFQHNTKHTFRTRIIYLFTLRTILRWRRLAWKNFLRFRAQKLSKQELLQQTLRRAKIIRSLEKLVVK